MPLRSVTSCLAAMEIGVFPSRTEAKARYISILDAIRDGSASSK